MADINASEFYNLGYGRQSPQIGYGRAQINKQRPMPNAPDLTQSFASGKKIRLAEEAQEQKKRKAQSDLDKTVGDALSGGVYINPALNEMQKRDIEAAKERFNNIDKSKNPDLEIQTIIKELEAKKEYYKNQDKRYVGAYDAATKMEGYYSNPLVTGIIGMDFSDATDEELANAFSGSIQVEQRLDPTKRRDEIGSAVVETLYKNPDYYTVNGTINDMGDLNEYMKKSTLTPEGVEYLKATLLSDQVLQDAIQQQNRFGNKPIDANDFIEDYIDANFSRSSSQFRSDNKDGNDNNKKPNPIVTYDKVFSVKTKGEAEGTGDEESGIKGSASEANLTVSGKSVPLSKGTANSNIAGEFKAYSLDGGEIDTESINKENVEFQYFLEPDVNTLPQKGQVLPKEGAVAIVTMTDQNGKQVRKQVIIDFFNQEDFFETNYPKEYKAFKSAKKAEEFDPNNPL